MTNLNNLKIDGRSIVSRVKLVQFENQGAIDFAYNNGAIEHGVFDDNGGDPDGELWLLPVSEINDAGKLPLGTKVVDGWQIDHYTTNANYVSHCGFTSRNVAYTTLATTAEAIARDEISVANQND